MRRREFITVLGGAAVGWPLTAQAQQQSGQPVIGFLSSRSAAESAPLVAAFENGLSDTGFVHRRNVSIVFKWADGKYGQLPGLAKELVESHATVIVATGGDIAARAARGATSTTPIVFLTVTDPAKP